MSYYQGINNAIRLFKKHQRLKIGIKKDLVRFGDWEKICRCFKGESIASISRMLFGQ